MGPVLELFDVIEVLKYSLNAPQDLKEKSVYLSAELMSLCGIKNSRNKAEKILFSGKAYEKFVAILTAQGGKNIEKKIDSLKLAKFRKVIKAKKSGKIVSISNNKINSLCRILGTPETKSTGVYLHHHTGEIKKGKPLLTLYSESKSKLKDGLDYIKKFKPIEIK